MVMVVLVAHMKPATSDADSIRSTHWKDRVTFEPVTNMYHSQTQKTRHVAWEVIKKLDSEYLRSKPCSLMEFGVYTGGGLREWLRMANSSGINGCTLYGFDSFEGLPDEPAYLKPAGTHQNPGWNAGGINTADVMGIYNWPALDQQLKKNIIGTFDAKVHLVRGFYNESLADGGRLVRKFHMVPPTIIDLDCDLYVSSMPALRFLLDFKLLVPGVIVYMDDVAKPHWEERNDPKKATHMAKAFAEITDEYGITWKDLMPPTIELTLAATRWWRPVVKMTACKKCEGS
jgi:hypothetical protein